ncbi:PAS domain S-box protein [Priestia abyssalis]|uniref:PAS domain S-box protein n=1 Tax=Priestia abyssalis TaxID=1221450 RepID=UPI00147427C1|nr:PAS domain S-box protein [Priestia abyssalis]
MKSLGGKLTNDIPHEHSFSIDEIDLIWDLHTFMTQMITRGDPLSTILEALTLRMQGQFKRKIYYSLLLAEGENRLVLGHAPNLPKEYKQAISLIEVGPKAGAYGIAAYRKEAVISSDIENDSRWDGCRDVALKFGLRACWTIPILLSGHVVGTFAIYHLEVCIPNVQESKMLEVCASLLGFAIERDQRLQLEKKLKESEQRFRSLFDYYPHSIYIFSLEGYFLGFNKGSAPLSGYGEKELIGKSFVPLIAPEDQEKVLHHFNRAKEGITQHYECKILHKEGHKLVLSLTLLPIMVHDEVVGVYGIARNITREKQVEQDLLTYHEELDYLFKNHQGMIFKYKKENGQFIHTFGQGQLIGRIGLRAEECVGKSLADFMPEEIASWKENFYERAWNGEETSYEGELNGVYYIATSKPVVRNGQVVEVIVSCNDITILKQSQQEALSLKQQLKLVLDSVGDGIYAMDTERKITLVNPAAARMLGYKSSELTGSSPGDTFRHCYELQFCIPYQTLLDGKIRHVKDEDFFRKDGTSFPTEYVCAPIWESGKISGVVVAFKDISERKMAEEYLVKSEKLEMAGQLAAGVAHEIRNPLTAIQGFIQLLEEGMSKPEYFSLIESEFERIEDIIGEFLALAKPQAVNFKKNDVRLLLEQTIQLMSTQAIMQGMEIVSFIDPDLPAIQCDKHQLKQVFINIIKNAMEATPSKGKLLITCEQTESHLHIMFKDQGVGIPKERLKRLFEPFYSTKEKGTGLGLMISYKIIEEHKGSIWFESEEGKGTTVHLLLPLSSGRNLIASETINI